MLERQYGKITFVCDDCGEELLTDTENFNEALTILCKEGWDREDSIIDDGWAHLCPDCS